MREQYSLIRIEGDTLRILKSRLDQEDITSYKMIYSENDCDRMRDNTVYAISDTAMYNIFGR